MATLMPEGSTDDRHATTETAEYDQEQQAISSRQSRPQRRSRKGAKRAAVRRFASRVLRCLEDRSDETVAPPATQTDAPQVPLITEAQEYSNSVPTSMVQVAPEATMRSAIDFLHKGLVMLDGLEELPMEAVASRQQLSSAIQQLEAVRDSSSRGTEPLRPPTTTVVSKAADEPEARQIVSGDSSLQASNATAQHDELPAVPPVAAAPTHSSAQATDINSDNTLSPALNSLVQLLWPRIKEYIGELLQTDVEPAINEALPKVFKGSVKFTKVSLGEKCPCLGPLRVERRQKSDDIEVSLGIRFDSDLNVELTAVGVPVGICRVSLQGQLVVVLGPTMVAPPFFGGVQVFFANPPQLDIHFLGAARVADIPGLRGTVRAAVADAIAGVCVLPRRIAVDLNEDDAVDITDLTYPEPVGILRFTLQAGRDLIASDINMFGPRTSDPYVVATLGCKTWTSPTVRKCLNPTWGSDGSGLAVDFPVHCESQQLHIKVFDWDFSSSDDLIGIAASLDINELLTACRGNNTVSSTEVPLLSAAGEPGAGTLVVSAEWLELRALRPEPPLQGPSIAHLSAKILHATGIPGGMDSPFTVRLRVTAGDNADIAITPAGATVASEDTGCEDSSGQPQHHPSLLGTMAKGIAALRSSKTNPMPNSPMTLCAEAATSASHPQASLGLAEGLQSACTALAGRGESADEIATLLGVQRHQVDSFLDIQRDSAKTCKAAKEALVNAVARPCFDEVLQLLLPSRVGDEHVLLELALLDKHQKCAGNLQLPFSQVLEADGLCLEGPFKLDGGAELAGSLQLRWLA